MWDTSKQPIPPEAQPPPIRVQTPQFQAQPPPPFQAQPTPFQTQPPPFQAQPAPFQAQPPIQVQAPLYMAQPPPIQVQVYNVPASSVPQYPAVQPVQQNTGWWSRNYKNKPQSNSVGTASLIFISGGMNMAWKLGFGTNQFSSDLFITDNLIMSWFIACIIGAIIGGFSCNLVPKKILVCFSSILVTIGGILQVSEPESYDAIMASRYLNGIAVGLVFPVTFVLVGEEVVKEMRGVNAASMDTMCFSCGIFIQIIYSTTWTSSTDEVFQAIQMSGVLNIIYGIIAFIMAALLIIESPLYYLARGDEQMAIDCLRRLQRPFTITYETYEQLEEHKRYLAESKDKSFIENAIYGLPALLKLCFYRSFMALSFSYQINFAFTYSTVMSTPYSVFPYILYAFARWIGPLIVSFTLDSKGRKSPMITGFVICTILAFTVGGICDDKKNLIDIDYMNAVKYLLIFFQLFATISMASSSAYLSEAFPLAVKPYYVAIVFIVEMLVHIIIICSTTTFLHTISNMFVYFLTLGALSLVFLAVAIYVMPETKRYFLRECLTKFRNFNNFRN
ncbi:uncharacterized protein ACRADG_002377 [Cochliomyia hominivorax]